jgi:FKBP-type peptidyl-prolyl cis-trans isomerase FkpA
MFRLLRSTRSLACAAGLAALTAAGCGDSPTGASDPTQLVVVDLVVGTGATAAAGNTVSVDYTVWDYDASKPAGKGQLLETSVGQAPYTFVLGTNAAIAGFDQGVTGMKVGGVRRVTVPSALAYGNGALVFDIALLSVS